MSEFYRRRPVTDRHDQRVKGLYETRNSRGLHWEVKTWSQTETKEHWVRLNAVDRDDAIQLAYKQHGQDEVERPLAKKLKLRQAKDEFLAEVKELKAGKTYRQRKKDLEQHILPVLGNLYFHQVEADRRLVLKVTKRMQENGYVPKGKTEVDRRPYAPGSINTAWNSLSAFLTWASDPDVGYAKSNPCHGYRAEKIPFRADASKAVNEDHVPSAESIQALIAQEPNEQYARLYEFCYETGARVSEAIGLLQSCVDLKKKAIVFTAQLGSGDQWGERIPLKGEKHRGGGQARVVPMSDRCIEIVREQLQYQLARGQRGGWFFSTRNETPFHQSTMHVALDDAYERCGIERVGTRLWHGFRHAYATRLFELNVPIERISRYLGHTTVEMTRKKYIVFLNHEDEGDEYRRILAEAVGQ